MEAIITVGISACGKSSYAGMVHHTEINRDDIRFKIVCPNAKGWKDYRFDKINEANVNREESRILDEAAEYGDDVIVSNTNINGKIRRGWIKALKKAGYDVKIVLFETALDDAIERDSHRRNMVVGEGVIKDQWYKLQDQLTQIENEVTLYGLGFEKIVN